MKYYANTSSELYKLTEFFIGEEFKILLELGIIIEEKRILRTLTQGTVTQVDYYMEDGEWAGYSISQSIQLSPIFMERYFPHLL